MYCHRPSQVSPVPYLFYITRALSTSAASIIYTRLVASFAARGPQFGGREFVVFTANSIFSVLSGMRRQKNSLCIQTSSCTLIVAFMQASLAT